jgi:hypothetical protein
MSAVVPLPPPIPEGQWRPKCVICGELVALEDSKEDEYGQAIHEECYISRLIGKKSMKDKSMTPNFC